MKKQISQVKRIFHGMGLVILGGLLIVGCATTDKSGNFSEPPADLFPPSTNGVPDGHVGGLAAITQSGDRFQIGDQVTVKFSGTTDENLRPHEERIKDDGPITLPYIGEVKAADKTPGELQKVIHDRYVPDYYKRLTVTVLGEQRVYSVGGQVKQPGRQAYISATTVTKAIQSAGDFTDFAAKRRVELYRVDGKKFIIDCKKAEKDPTLDLPVYPGDKIVVPQRGILDTFD